MTLRTMLSVLVMSVAVAAPASANWFSRPNVGINLNVGSAPNPTPYDLRIAEGYYVGRPLVENLSIDMLRDMDGKTVYGANGENLGSILAVNETAGLVDVQLPTGVAVTLEATRLVNEPDRVVAPMLSQADMLALAQQQTGRTVALEIHR
jgi:hypothetical protein